MDFIDFHQQDRLRAHDTEINKAQRAADNSVDQIRDLQDAVERLALACRAMWELLRQSSGCTEEQLLDKVRELDLLDGKKDGKLRAAAKLCSQCSRPNNVRRAACLYCGEELPAGSAFDVS